MKYIIVVVLLMTFGIGYNYRSEISELLETNHVVYASSHSALKRFGTVKSLNLNFKVSHKGGNNKIFHDALNANKPSLFIEGINNLQKFEILDELKSNFHRVGTFEIYHSAIISHIHPEKIQEKVDEYVRLDKPFILMSNRKYLVNTSSANSSHRRLLISLLKSYNPDVRILPYYDPISNRSKIVATKKADFSSVYGKKEDQILVDYLEKGDLFIFMVNNTVGSNITLSKYAKNVPKMYNGGVEFLRSLWVRNDFPKDKELLLVEELKNSDLPKYDNGFSTLTKLDESEIDYDVLYDNLRGNVDKQ
jgi:hypothetical protein